MHAWTGFFLAQVKSLDTWTHAYSFWEGVPVDSRRAFARLFRASKTLQVTLACLGCRPIATVLQDMRVHLPHLNA